MDTKSARDKRARHFDRRARAAREGVHLPSLTELLRGMPMFGNRLSTDAQEFACRVLMRMKGENVEETLLGAALRMLSVSIETADLLQAAKAFEVYPESRKLTEAYLEDAKRRCYYYAATKGDREAMLRVAGYAIDEAERIRGTSDVASELYLSAIGWLSLSQRPGHYHAVNGHRDAQTIGSHILMIVNDEQTRHVDKLIAEVEEKRNQNLKGGKPEAANNDTPTWVTDEALSAVVIEAIGNADVNQGKDVVREFNHLVGARLPLCPVRDLDNVRATLWAEFPHASTITDRVLNRLVEAKHVRTRPILFVGEPGCGKTSYAQRLLQLLGVPSEVVPCGGTSDSSFMGTARRWSSGEPSIPLSLVRRYMTASPGIILDEVEKASESRHNGSLYDCLLGLLETQSASTWRDPYIQAPINLAHVVWVGTANSIQGVPPVLLDRMTVMAFPEPGPQHLHPLANSILKRSYLSRGYDEKWATPLDVEELEALWGVWPGGSLRVLQRLIDGIIDAREALSVIQ